MFCWDSEIYAALENKNKFVRVEDCAAEGHQTVFHHEFFSLLEFRWRGFAAEGQPERPAHLR
jgi:hypothetical protein